MSFLTSVFKAQDALEDQEQGALESEKHVPKVCYFGERNPHMLATSLHWEGKECLPAFKVLPFSFPQQNQVLRSRAHSYKENSSFTERTKFLEQRCNALSSLKAAKEVELKLLRKKVDIVVDFSERRTAAAEK